MGMANQKLHSATHASMIAAPRSGTGWEVSWSLENMRSYPTTDLVFFSPPIKGWTLVAGQQLAYIESLVFPSVPQERHPDRVVELVRRFSLDTYPDLGRAWPHRASVWGLWRTDRGHVRHG